jgi:hypothetical protein
MSVNAPFTPTGNTVVIIAANPAPTPVQVTSYSGGSNQYRIINSGTVVAFLGFGANATSATAGANAPNTSLGNCLPLLPGTDEIITFVPNGYFTANASTSCSLYLTCGDGS